MKLLLDTCTFLWIVGGSPRLSQTASELFEDPGNEVYLSVASSWEMAIKSALGELRLPAPVWRFVPTQRTAHGIESLAIDEESALQLERLPALHNDPFDRIMTCQSIVHGLTILTPDESISQYPVRVAW